MMRLPHHSASLRRRLRSERAFAVPTVLLAMVAAFGLASAAVVASVSSQEGSVRDQNTKSALAAADAGVSNAMLRYNRVPTTDASDICAPLGGTSANVDGWCPIQAAGEIDRGAFSYWVRPTDTELQIVATGTVDGVTRRVEVVAQSAQSPPQGTQPFADFSVIGLDFLNQESNARITANAATNGDITLDSNAQLTCEPGGGAQVGDGRDVIEGSNAHFNCGTLLEGSLSLPPVNQGDVATVNDNDRITMAKAGQSGGDTISGNKNSVTWDPTARRLETRANVSLTLGGANYSLCTLELSSNSNLFVVGGQAVRIYFDSPEACGLAPGTAQLRMDSNTSLEATGSEPGDLALLFVGSDSIPTSIELASNTQANGPCEQSFVVYAPRTDIDLASNAHICGAIAGKSINAASNATVTTSSLASEFELPNTETQYFLGYEPGTFVECSATPPAPTSAPDEGC